MDTEFSKIKPDHLWLYDKLILSSKLGYLCGPVGTPVPQPHYYIVRPCVNFIGLGMGASIEYIEDSTDHLPPGYFWCEIFEGPHLSVDYQKTSCKLVVEGIKSEDTLQRWDKWVKKDTKISIPDFLRFYSLCYEWLNVEMIGGKIIEVHLRQNPDFQFDNTEFIPVWEGQETTPPDGYSYVMHPDIHGRIGGFIK